MFTTATFAFLDELVANNRRWISSRRWHRNSTASRRISAPFMAFLCEAVGVRFKSQALRDGRSSV